MKRINLLLSLFVLATIIISCEKDEPIKNSSGGGMLDDSTGTNIGYIYIKGIQQKFNTFSYATLRHYSSTGGSFDIRLTYTPNTSNADIIIQSLPDSLADYKVGHPGNYDVSILYNDLKAGISYSSSVYDSAGYFNFIDLDTTNKIISGKFKFRACKESAPTNCTDEIEGEIIKLKYQDVY